MGDNIVVNEYDITEKLYIKWAFEVKREGAKLAFMIFWTIMILISGQLFIVYRRDYLHFLAMLYCVYMGYLRDYIMARKYFENTYGEGGIWHRKIRITKDDIVIDDGKVVVNYKTSDIKKVVENDERIRLFMNDKKSIRLYKNAFVQGDLEMCKEYCHM